MGAGKRPRTEKKREVFVFQHAAAPPPPKNDAHNSQPQGAPHTAMFHLETRRLSLPHEMTPPTIIIPAGAGLTPPEPPALSPAARADLATALAAAFDPDFE